MHDYIPSNTMSFNFKSYLKLKPVSASIEFWWNCLLCRFLSIWCLWWHISAIACLIMSSYQIVTYSFVTEYILKPCSCPINAIQYLTSRHNIWKVKLLKDRYIWKVESWYNFSQVNVIIWKTSLANYVDLSENYFDLLDHYVDFADILLSSRWQLEALTRYKNKIESY